MAEKLIKTWKINGTQLNSLHIKTTWTKCQEDRMPKNKLEMAQPYITQT